MKVAASLLEMLRCLVLPNYAQKTPSQDIRWISTADLHPQTSRQSHLSDEQLARVKRIQATLAEVDPSSLDKWIEDFEKDRDPEGQIQVWEAMAGAYQNYCSSHQLDLVGKRDVFKILLLRSQTENEEEILNRSNLKALTGSQARDVIKSFHGKATPDRD